MNGAAGHHYCQILGCGMCDDDSDGDDEARWCTVGGCSDDCRSVRAIKSCQKNRLAANQFREVTETILQCQSVFFGI